MKHRPLACTTEPQPRSCVLCAPQYGLVHISVGDLLRDEVSRGSPIGKKAKDFMDKGVLVPDQVVVEMVKERLAQSDVAKKGWLLDGYPRSAVQAEAIEAEKIRPDLFLLINVSERVTGDGSVCATRVWTHEHLASA